jgi:hypothetical protein
MVQEMWSFPGRPSSSDSSLASQPSLVDTAVMLMKYLVENPLPLGVDGSLDV